MCLEEVKTNKNPSWREGLHQSNANHSLKYCFKYHLQHKIKDKRRVKKCKMMSSCQHRTQEKLDETALLTKPKEVEQVEARGHSRLNSHRLDLTDT